MNWLLGGAILLAVGITLHRLLRLGEVRSPRPRGLVPLCPECEAIFQPVALEVETQAAILGISLNEAFDERDAQHAEMAWRLVKLSSGHWERLAEVVNDLVQVLLSRLPRARTLVLARTVAADLFKTRPVFDNVRLHEFLDQLVFSSRGRFHLQVRLLRRTVGTLTREFRHTFRYGERTLDCSPEVWERLDSYFHDLDIISKETLLALRTLLACLPATAVEDVAADLHALLQRGVRVTAGPADR
jgi:hypothetical protein